MPAFLATHSFCKTYLLLHLRKRENLSSNKAKTDGIFIPLKSHITGWKLRYKYITFYLERRIEINRNWELLQFKKFLIYYGFR